MMAPTSVWVVPCVDLGQAEVGDLGLAVGRDEHVRRFQVAVHDPSAVRVIDRPGQCFHQGSRRARWLGLPASERASVTPSTYSSAR